jgi:hypothetical protein
MSDTSKKPTHIAFHVKNLNDDKSFWTRVGAAWEHKDGKGLSVQLDCIPVDGRLELRIPEDK